MARQVFYSFHYKPDVMRVQKVRNIGKIEDNKPAREDTWDSIKRQGDKAIKDWIARNMKNRSCIVVLIGNKTSTRYYVRHEVQKAWCDGRGVLGIHIHNLVNMRGERSEKGKSPFSHFNVKIDNKNNKKNMDDVVLRIDPPYKKSQNVYNYIRDNMAEWIERAISIRRQHP